MRNVGRVIVEAKRRLIKSPIDLGHDVNHHLAVWRNCQLIIAKERLKVDREALKIAAWWHDFERGSRVHSALTLFLKENNFGKGEIAKIVKIINEHSFGDRQTLDESKVLYDADKLEYISVPRWERALEKLSKRKMQKYRRLFKQRLPKIVKAFHYVSAKKLFDKRFENWRRWTKLEGIYKQEIM